MRRSRVSVALPLLAGLAGCASSSDNVFGTAFPLARMGRPEARLETPPGSFTLERILGRPDGLEPLGPDTTLNLVEADGRTLRDLLDVEGRREIRDVLIPPDVVEPQSQPRRGSSTPPQASVLPEVAPRPVPPPPAPAAAATPPVLPPGTTIPGPRGGTVMGGSAGSVGTTIGPSGRTGTATRDGGTVTLYGPDGSIRTVPVPPR